MEIFSYEHVDGRELELSDKDDSWSIRICSDGTVTYDSKGRC